MDLEDPHYKGLGEDLKELYVQELHGFQDNLEDPHYQRYQEALKDSRYQGLHGLQGDQEDPNYQGLQEDLKELHFQKLHGLQKDMKEKGQEVLDDHDVFQPIEFQSFPGFQYPQNKSNMEERNADFKLSSDYFGRDGRKVKVISVKSIAESISDS